MKATKADAALEACVAALGAFIEHDNAHTRKALAEARQRFRNDASAAGSSAACSNTGRGRVMSDALAIFSPEIEVAMSKPDTKAGRLQRVCLELVFAHGDEDALPTSARFIYHELIQSGVVLKKGESADGEGQRPDQPVINAAASPPSC